MSGRNQNVQNEKEVRLSEKNFEAPQWFHLQLRDESEPQEVQISVSLTTTYS